MPPEVWSRDAAWDVLERFGQALQQAGQSRQQIALVLESVCASLGADTVFWEGGVAPVEALGRVQPGPDWCRQFTAWLVSQEVGSPQHLLSNHPRPPWLGGGVLAPASVALVRISRSQGSWLGALSFSPRRLFDATDIRVMLLARRILLNHRQQAQALEQLRDSLFGLVRCLAAAIDAKDPYTAGHSERVARTAVRLGQQMRLPAGVISDLYLAGLLHDVGKIGTRDSVLQKPGALTEEERLHMQEHTLVGDRLISVVQPLAHLRAGVRNHHERYDGTGYPDGLIGDDIPLLARVLAVADGCDAMVSARPYRPAMAPERVDAVMRAGAGTQWHPEVVEQFFNCRHDLYSICQRGLGDSVIAAVDHVLERAGLLATGAPSRAAPLS